MNFYTDFKLKEIDEDVDKSLIVDFLEKREIDNRFNLQFNEKYRFLIFLRETSKKALQNALRAQRFQPFFTVNKKRYKMSSYKKIKESKYYECS
ncbi:MAG TPA: hypothetical protein PLO89_06975 [Spirochaetota bacterium]|nr:hypothetical protein [Spirochaetota bacterium]